MTDVAEPQQGVKRAASAEPEVDAKKIHTATSTASEESNSYQKGVAAIKKEYIISLDTRSNSNAPMDDDQAESGGTLEVKKDKGKRRGQNKNRKLNQGKENVKLCDAVLQIPPIECKFGEYCRFEHDIDKYLAAKPEDIPGVCPVFQAIGYCPSGIRCRWLFSHFNKETKDLVIDEAKWQEAQKTNYEVNKIDVDNRVLLQKRKIDFTKAEEYIKYIDSQVKTHGQEQKQDAEEVSEEPEDGNAGSKVEETKENANAYVEAPFHPSEKKPLFLSRAKIVSPLTTVGNLPYRRLMKTLGADVTYSEMALCLPLVQGAKAEWALTRAHCSEIPGFGVQLATSKYWQAVKAVDALERFGNVDNKLSEYNLNCGCPIDLIYRTGAGSGLMDNPTKMFRILNGMNQVSGETPVTVKIRMGTRDGKPTAIPLVKRLMNETTVAAITIHGRSRQQRYTKLADWDYIGQVAEATKQAFDESNKDERQGRRPWIIGNGDCYSFEDWNSAVNDHKVDSVMVARGALIKPWIFEEIEAGQYLDKSATERLEYLRTYANYALEHWGSDEYGLNMARRFLCEFMSFTHRYIPVGIMERLPPKLNERPPLWRGRNELETLLASNDYKDWIKITEMFLGPVSEGFKFTPKHKSNSVPSE